MGGGQTAERFEGGEDWSYGLHRLEPLAALLNGILLVPMVGYVLWESYERFLAPAEIDPVLTLVVATGGLLVNLGSVAALEGGARSLNERGAFYHLLGDTAGSVAVIVATVAVAAFDLRVADPIAAVLVAALVLWSAGTVLRDSASLLLQRSPVPIDGLRAELAGIDGVDGIDDVHVWQVCSQLTVGTARVVPDVVSADQRRAVRSDVRSTLAEHGIDHVTVELAETAERDDADPDPHAH